MVIRRGSLKEDRMDTPDNSVDSLIPAVVRGERPIRDLTKLGIRVRLYDEVCEIDNPQLISVKVAPADLAHGFLRLQHDPTELRRWATIILSGSSFLDLELLEEHPDGETLLDGLWDASFNGRITDALL